MYFFDEGHTDDSCVVEYNGMNSALSVLNHYNFDSDYDSKWLTYYLDYVEFLND